MLAEDMAGGLILTATAFGILFIFALISYRHDTKRRAYVERQNSEIQAVV
jgi:hypothetical protein